MNKAQQRQSIKEEKVFFKSWQKQGKVKVTNLT
jgi:hypothetical protein